MRPELERKRAASLARLEREPANYVMQQIETTVTTRETHWWSYPGRIASAMIGLIILLFCGGKAVEIANDLAKNSGQYSSTVQTVLNIMPLITAVVVLMMMLGFLVPRRGDDDE